MSLLKDRIAVITGAGSPRGLGRATAQLFAEHGARVVVLDLDPKAAAETKGTLKGRGHASYGCDVTRAAQCTRAVERILKKYGRIDVLVNIAGITSPQRVMEVDEKTYEKVFDVNMRGTLLMTQAVVPGMRAQKSGSIVNMSSVSAQRGGGVFGGSHYSAAKAAVLGYTKACARELAPDNIRVNAVCPSFIDTNITAGMLTPEKLAQIVASVPMGRPGKAAEVAGPILFLASDLSSYMTGVEIDIHGGSHIH